MQYIIIYKCVQNVLRLHGKLSLCQCPCSFGRLLKHHVNMIASVVLLPHSETDSYSALCSSKEVFVQLVTWHALPRLDYCNADRSRNVACCVFEQRVCCYRISSYSSLCCFMYSFSCGYNSRRLASPVAGNDSFTRDRRCRCPVSVV